MPRPTVNVQAVMPSHPRRRSCLTVPGGSEKMVRKAAELAADEIVFDLEDAVAEDCKTAARSMVVEAVASGRFASRQLAVRINAIGTPWCHADMVALAGLSHPGLTLVLPKIETVGDLAFADRLLLGLEAERQRAEMIGLQILVETAAGLANCAALACASARLQSLIIGYGDLASALGRSTGASWNFAQEIVLLAARSNGLQAIDGPSFSLTSANGALVRDSAAAADIGFDGKWAIHPSQVAPINTAFTPAEAEVRRARGILSALDAARLAGTGVATFEGTMIDEAMRFGAIRTLARTGELS